MFLLFWAIYLSSRCKKAKRFQELYPLNSHQGSAMNPLQSLHHFKTPTCIQKLNLCSKMDISKTAWINVCLYMFLVVNYKFVKLVCTVLWLAYLRVIAVSFSIFIWNLHYVSTESQNVTIHQQHPLNPYFL